MQRRAILTTTAGASLLGLGVLAAACKSTEPEPVSPAAVHAVDSDELEKVMRALMRADSTLLPQELDLGPKQRRQREQIAALAGSIAESADDIPAVVDDVGLTEEARLEFVQLAQELEDEARALADDAAGLSNADLKARTLELRETCTACHSRFRVLPVVPAQESGSAPR